MAFAAFETKFGTWDNLGKKMSVVESEAMDKDCKITSLAQLLDDHIRISEDIRGQVESINANRRLSSLIATCADFGNRSSNENTEE